MTVTAVAVLRAKPGLGPLVIASLREAASLADHQSGCELSAVHLEQDEDAIVVIEQYPSRSDLDASPAAWALPGLIELNDDLLVERPDVWFLDPGTRISGSRAIQAGTSTRVEAGAAAPASDTAVRIAQEMVDGPHGPVPIRRYQPGRTLARQGLLWLHGGSFLGGDLDMPEAHDLAKALAQRGIPVVTVGYRLAPVPPEFAVAAGGIRPGVHYPVAVDEIEHVFLTLAATSAMRWAIGGSSAGGGLAASVAVRLRDASAIIPSALVLTYPLLHRVLPQPSARLAARLAGEVLEPSAAEVTTMNENYLGPDPQDGATEGAFVGDQPAHDLPPILLIDSEVDLLRASSQQFAASVVLAGGDITYLIEPGTRHGHLNRPGPAARHSIDRIARWLLDPTPLHAPLSEGRDG